MKNISRNGIQAAVVYRSSYLGHKCLPSFSTDGQSPFTIEIRFVYTKASEGILYAQDDGIIIGFKDDIPYAEHPVLGNLYGTWKRKMKNNGLMMVSVTFDGSQLKLQLNGIEVVSRTAASSGAACLGDYAIGKDFNGFIEGIRIVKSAMTDAELVCDYGNGFQQRADIAFQTDFTTKQYKDIGPDKVPLWRTGTEAHCSNVVAATRLDQDGAYVRQDKLSFTDELSVCGRFYPDFRSLTKQTIYAIGNNTAMLSLYMEADAENRYFLCVKIGDKILRSNAEIEGLMWHDVAVSVDFKNRKAELYLDGACTAYDSIETGGMKDTTAIIGAEFFTDKPQYTNGFAGYLDYFAEFSKAIAPSEAAELIEHEPYFYNEGITSLLLFGWGEPRDAMQGKNIAEFGAGYFTFAADTMPIDAPTGVGWKVTQDADEEYWNTLTDNQKWALTLYIQLVTQTLNGTSGINLLANSGTKDFSIVHRRYNDHGAREVLAWANGEAGTDDMMPLLNDDTPGQERIQEVFKRTSTESWYSVSQRTSAASGSGAVIAPVCAGAYMTTGKNIESMAAAAVIVGLIVLAAKIISELEKERPVNPRAELVLESVSWNKNGRAEQGTVYFHCEKGKPSGPASMEWAAGTKSTSIMAVFVPSLLQDLVMQVKVKNKGNKTFQGTVSIRKDSNSSDSSAFTLAAGEEKLIEIVHKDLADFQKKEVRKERGTYGLYCMEGKNSEFMSRIEYTYFTLLGKPIEPWLTDEGKAYDPDNKGYIHTDILQFITEKSSDAAVNHTVQSDVEGFTPEQNNLVCNIVYQIYGCIYFGYADMGATHYTSNLRCFKYTKYLNDCYSVLTHGGSLSVNCMDCANMVSAFSAMYGVLVPMVILTGSGGFRCNQIQIIAANNVLQWNVPFPAAPNPGVFSYHMFNSSNVPQQDINQVPVYDACLALDFGSYPGLDFPANQNKNGLIPSGMMACGGNDIRVDVPVTAPYNLYTYRERLVRDGQIADYFCHAIIAGPFDPALNAERNEAFENILSSNEHITALTFAGAEYGEYEWRCEYQGSKLEICHYAGAADDIDHKMQEVVHSFTTVDREKVKDSGVEGYRIGRSAYVIKKDAHLYRVLGEKAWEAVLDIFGD